jgi:hypothetical protein
MTFYNIFDVSGTNRSLKIPLGLKNTSPKKYCVNHSKMERDARKRVRNLNKYKRTVERSVGRDMKVVSLRTYVNDYASLLEWEEE